MKKILSLFFVAFMLCGFAAEEERIHAYYVDNDSADDWEVSIETLGIKAYHAASETEVWLAVDAFMPNSPLCLSNKRIRDIKFDVIIYKVAHKGDSNWSKMVNRMQIQFIGKGYNEQRRIYGSTILKDSAQVKVGETVNVGTLQFLAPYPCRDADQMRMRVSNIIVRGRALPTLDIKLKLKQKML